MTVSAVGEVGYRTPEQQNRLPQKTLGKNDFMRLLITQLQHQDPMQPMEDKEFILQMAQLTSLEEIQNLNKNMSAFLANQEARQSELALVSALGLMGMEVEVKSPDTGETLSATVTGIKITSGLTQLVLSGQEDPMPLSALIGIYQNAEGGVPVDQQG